MTEITPAAPIAPPAALTMAVGHKLTIAACAVLLVLLALGAREWLKEHDARMKAESTTAADAEAMQSAQKQIDGLKADSAQQAMQLAQRIAALEVQKQQPATPDQLAAMMNALLPKGAPPVTVQQDNPNAKATPGGANQPLPAAPTVQVPQADVTTLRNYGLTCEENAAQAATCGKQLADAQGADALQKQQLADETKTANTWKTAAKGGSLLHRVLKTAECVAVAGAGAAGGAELDKAQPWRGSAIGAAAGGVACQLW